MGARLGKSGGSIIQLGLLGFGTLATITPYIAAILFIIIGAWIVAVRALNKQFTKLTAEQAAAAELKAPASAV